MSSIRASQDLSVSHDQNRSTHSVCTCRRLGFASCMILGLIGAASIMVGIGGLSQYKSISVKDLNHSVYMTVGGTVAIISCLGMGICGCHRYCCKSSSSHEEGNRDDPC